VRRARVRTVLPPRSWQWWLHIVHMCVRMHPPSLLRSFFSLSLSLCFVRTRIRTHAHSRTHTRTRHARDRRGAESLSSGCHLLCRGLRAKSRPREACGEQGSHSRFFSLSRSFALSLSLSLSLSLALSLSVCLPSTPATTAKYEINRKRDNDRRTRTPG